MPGPATTTVTPHDERRGDEHGTVSSHPLISRVAVPALEPSVVLDPCRRGDESELAGAASVSEKGIA